MYKFNWKPDLLDERDYTENTPVIKDILKASTLKGGLPSKIDLSDGCSPIQDQGSLGSCTAQAGVSMIEFYHKKYYGKYIDLSRIFLYKATRDLLGFKGDSGAYIRSTLGALALFGTCPEQYLPYDISKFDEEPSNFCYEMAKNYQVTKRYRLDDGSSNYNLLNKIKNNANRGLVAEFGFMVYESINQSANGNIVLPKTGERVLGGHAVMVVGYDDTKVIYNANGTKSVGAIKFQNSWGTGWGENGFGYMPYDYIIKGLTSDWWVVLKSEWLDLDRYR